MLRRLQQAGEQHQNNGQEVDHVVTTIAAKI
jgi:hypothetical protein